MIVNDLCGGQPAFEAELFAAAIACHPVVVAPNAHWQDLPVQAVVEPLSHSQQTAAPPCIVIQKHGKLLGIVTRRDLEHWQHPSQRDRPIREIMSSPVVTLTETEFTDPFAALDLLNQRAIAHLPILSRDRRLLGVATTQSLIELGRQLYSRQQQVIDQQHQQLNHQSEHTQQRCQTTQDALQQSQVQVQETLTALKHSESRLRALIDALPDLIMRVRSDGSYLDFFPSKTFKIIKGSDRPERSLWDGCLPLELAERRMHYIQRALQNNSLQIYEQQIQIDDKVRTEEVRIAVCGEDEVLLIVRDISDRKEVENALIQLNQDLESKIRRRTQSLKESEERFRQIFEQSPLGIAITDLDGYVVRANSRLSNTLGYPKTSDVLGLSIQELLCITPSSEGILPLEKLLEQTLSVIAFESQPITKDGRILWVNITSALIFSSAFPSAIIHLVEDITDRKHIEQQLRNLSDRLSIAVQAGEIGIWEWNTITNELVWDDRMYQLYGLHPSKFIGTYTAWLNCLHPDDRNTTHTAIQKALKGDREFDLEFRILHPNHSIHFIKAAGLVQRDIHGSPQRMIGVNFDITNHKQAQSVIAQYAREVEDLYNNAPCGYHSLDTHGRFIKINNTELQWLGYGREEVLGKRFEEFVTQESAEKFRAHYPVFKEQGSIQDIEFDLLCKDQTIFPVLLNATAMKDKDGTYLYSRSTLFDHRKLKAASTHLKRQLVAIEAAIDGIAILDRSGYTYVNKAHLELFGYHDPDEMLGHNWTILYTSETVTWFERDVFPHLKQQGFWQGEAQAIRKDGSTFIEGLSLTLTESGEIICVCRDISQQKYAEEQLHQVNERLTLTNADLYRATRLRDEFLANMSHELRTPLNAILGMAEGLNEGVFGAMNMTQIDAVNTIAQSGQHLLELINDILDLSKAEASKLELQVAPTDIQYLCISSLTFVKQQAQQKKIKLFANIPEFLPTIVVDERRIRQVLINLLTNAVKFTPDGGTIQVVVQPDATVNPPMLMISIIDTGIGIASENLDKLFKPFSQIDSSLNRRYAGTGLGLALVRRLIELHHGTVQVTSTFGMGSCFTIGLPYTTYQMPPERPATPLYTTIAPPFSLSTRITPPLEAAPTPYGQVTQPIATNAPRILLAEDNEANIATIASYLNARGYHTILARNGREAVAIAQAEHPDLILMDIQMPEMDGLAAMQQIRTQPDLDNIPMIALTALAMPGDRDRCLAAGATEYCTKPVKLKQLIGLIRSLLPSVAE